jgi:hypothetical protein
MSRDPLAGAVAVLATPVGPVAGAQQAPGVAPLSGREVELSSAGPSSGDALLVAYLSAVSQVRPPGLGDPPTQGG